MPDNSQTKTNTASDRLIGSIAIIKSDLIEKDFISTYIPFIATVLLKIDADPIKISDVIDGFRSEYGFTIERAPMVAILNKCVKKGLVQRQKNGTYTIDKETCVNNALSEQRLHEQEEKYKKVIERLSAYYDEHFPNINHDKETIENNFMLFLSNNSAQTLIHDISIAENEKNEKKHEYIISNFIRGAKDNDPECYRLIVDIATGYLMASAIAYGDNDERTRIEGFHNLVLYIDTPLLLRILGLNDEDMQSASLALLERLKETHCLFRVFRHTYEETLTILGDCLHWIERSDYDESHASLALRTFVKKRYTKSDIQEYIYTLESRLNRNNIEIDDEDYYAGKYFHSQIEDSFIEESIINTYKNKNPSFNAEAKDSTITYDVKSISAIFKLWGTNKPRTYRQAKYILLTTNNTLAFVTRQYTIKENPGSTHGIYPCITEVFLGTNIWLSAPVQKIEDFSEKKLMSDCMSIIQPSERLISSIQHYINQAYKDRTITEEQFYLLRSKAFETDFLQNKILNDETAFNDSIMEEVLERIEISITKPYIEEIDSLKSAAEASDVEAKRYQDSYQSALGHIKKQKERVADQKRLEKEKDASIEEQAKQELSTAINIGLGIIALSVLGFICSVAGVVPITSQTLRIGIVVSTGFLILLISLFTAFYKYSPKFANKLVKWRKNQIKTKEYKMSLK